MQIKTAWALGIDTNSSQMIQVSKFDCKKGLDRFRQQVKPFKHVGVVIYEHVVKDAGHGVKPYPTGKQSPHVWLTLVGDGWG